MNRKKKFLKKFEIGYDPRPPLEVILPLCGHTLHGFGPVSGVFIWRPKFVMLKSLMVQCRNSKFTFSAQYHSVFHFLLYCTAPFYLILLLLLRVFLGKLPNIGLLRDYCWWLATCFFVPVFSGP